MNAIHGPMFCANLSCRILPVLAAATLLGCLDPQSGPGHAVADGTDAAATGNSPDAGQGSWATDAGMEQPDSCTARQDTAALDLGVLDGDTDPTLAGVSLERDSIVLRNAPRFGWVLFWVARPDNEPPYHVVRCVAGGSRASGGISFPLPDPPRARRCFLPSTDRCLAETFTDANDPVTFRLYDGLYRATNAECGNGSGDSFAAFAWRH